MTNADEALAAPDESVYDAVDKGGQSRAGAVGTPEGLSKDEMRIRLTTSAA